MPKTMPPPSRRQAAAGYWYAKNLGGPHDQALIIDETTGANIAVVYDKPTPPSLLHPGRSKFKVQGSRFEC
ncbi:MAG TPA: hypothetical protein VFZ59_16205 [Verrucomicrobiae bacterium]|nr:hypothetical protein [Verrucomicrobiae bacterium]